MGKFHQGKFIPVNPQKYVGDWSQIFFRSNWEKKCMIWFDMNPDVIKWSSEEIVIPYVSPVDSRQHRYFPDFLIQVKRPNGAIVTYLVEVKPEKQTQPPKKPKRITPRYIQECCTYGVNEAKWEAAHKYCKQKGFIFMILTEKAIRP